jgi:hypothetical protein
VEDRGARFVELLRHVGHVLLGDVDRLEDDVDGAAAGAGSSSARGAGASSSSDSSVRSIMGVSSWVALFGLAENGDVLKRGLAFGCDAGDAGVVTTPELVSSLNSLGSKFWKSPSPPGAEAAAGECFRGAYFM